MSKKGFTLVEVLLSLVVTSIILVNCSLFFKMIRLNNNDNSIDLTIENAIYTLSQELICSHGLTYGNSLTFYNEDNEQENVILENNRLVITPGYNILCHGINDISFINDKGLIKVKIYKDNNWLTYIVGSDYEIKEEG